MNRKPRRLDEDRDRNTIEDWFVQADALRTRTELNAFIDRVTDGNNHDYGTIVQAFAAVLVGTAKVIDRTARQGGISGLQASCVMWEFVRRWLRLKGPIRLVRYDLMLFPQYEREFDKIIDRSTWMHLQSEAKKHLAEAKADPSVMVSKDVLDHWQRIVDGHIPFGYSVDRIP